MNPLSMTETESNAAAREINFHPKKIQISVLSLLVWTLIIAVPTTTFGLIAIANKGVSIGKVVILVQPVLFFLLWFWYLRMQKKHYRCIIEHDGVRLHDGIWWQSETFVPAARIQHTEVTQGPFQRRWGMAELELHTAGTHVGKLKVHGIYKDDAVAIRDLLLHRRQGL